MTPVVHVSKIHQTRCGRKWFATAKPKKRIESADNAMEDPTMQQAVSWSQSEKISEDANAELQSILAGLCESINGCERDP